MKTLIKNKTMIAAILLAAIAVIGLSFSGAFASTMSTAVSPTPTAVSTTSPSPSPILSVAPFVIPIRSSWVRIDGNITSWGTQVAPEIKGALTMMTATTSKGGVPAAWFDSATAIWTNTTSTNTRQAGSVSVSYYAARLVKTDFTATNFQGNDFYLNGTWSVANITITRTVTKTDGSINIQSNTNITPIEVRVYGELNVTGSWTKFTLGITGIPLLDGTVNRSIERQTVFNRFDIINAGQDTTVTRADLTTIEHDYGAVPGNSNYDENMDFHGTYQIDICDIATIAANVQS